MNNELLQPTETLNTWWSLTPDEQSEIEKTIPEHTTLTLPITKHKSGVWTLSLPQWKTLNESLTGGTEKVLDYHYKEVIGVEPKTGDQLLCTLSKEELKDYTTKWCWLNIDPIWKESNYYLDSGTYDYVWLCPYLQTLYKEVPIVLWVKVEPVTS